MMKFLDKASFVFLVIASPGPFLLWWYDIPVNDLRFTIFHGCFVAGLALTVFIDRRRLREKS